MLYLVRVNLKRVVKMSMCSEDQAAVLGAGRQQQLGSVLCSVLLSILEALHEWRIAPFRALHVMWFSLQ